MKQVKRRKGHGQYLYKTIITDPKKYNIHNAVYDMKAHGKHAGRWLAISKKKGLDPEEAKAAKELFKLSVDFGKSAKNKF